MSLRSGLFTLAFVFAGALAFIVIALSTVVLIADHDSGAPFNDSAGATPAPATSEGDQVATRQGSTAHDGNGKWVDPIALVAEARVYFIKEILGN
jgi:hypothetical protein